MCVIGMNRIILLATTISKKIKIKNPFNKTTLVISLIVVTTFVVNFVVLINNAEPYIEPINNATNTTSRRPSRTFTCYQPESFFKIWDVYHMLMYSLVPFIVMFVQNFAISYLTYRHTHRMKKYGDNESDVKLKTPALSDYPVTMTATQSAASTSVGQKIKRKQSKSSYIANLLIFLTISFFFTTLPYSMIYAADQNNLFNNNQSGLIAKRVLLSLQYIRHATNFLIYVLTSSIICNEIKSFQTEWSNYIRKKLGLK
jgi:hypothetical protein